MKILFISDIHGVYKNLELIDNILIEEKIDKLVCLGDMYYQGPTYKDEYKIDSNKVHEFLNNHKDMLICMRGNCDSDVDVKASDFPINSGISLINTDNINIYITHGNEYSYEKNNKLNKDGVLVYGHLHRPFIIKEDDMIYINTGSISLPRNDIATYLIYDNKKFTIYDINKNIIDEINL